jgi:hypothetical protein
MNKPMLWTFLLEYDGGTYISQVRAADLTQGLVSWPIAVPDSDLAIWGLTRSDLAGLNLSGAVPIQGVTNVWCASGLTRSDKQILIHIVATSS